jgi:hypothetical protein
LKLSGELRRGPFLEKAQQQHRTLALRQALHATAQLLDIHRRSVFRHVSEFGGEVLEQAFPTPFAAAQVDDRPSARTKHERRDALGIAHTALAQSSQGHHKYILGQIGRSLGFTQMAKTIEASARGETSVQERLCL